MAAPALVTPYAVLSFPQLFSPKPRAESGPPVFSCALLFTAEKQKSSEYKTMVAAVRNLAKAKFPTTPIDKLTLPFKKAEEKPYAGYEPGMIYINPWSTYKPEVIDRQKQEILDPAEVWAGQIVRAYVTPFNWTNSGKHGISFGLNHIQVVKKDSPRIDGRAPARNVFPDLADEYEDEDDVDSVL
jgi:hypothetical protein